MSSVFKKSLPVTVTSFINKSGTIGLSIIPIILVERHISTDESSLILGAIRAAGLAGVLLGGWSCDALGLRKTLLLSFAVCGLGLAPLLFFKSALMLALLACLAQIGTSLYSSSARLLITQLVPLENRREAIGWQRTANNMALIFSYTLGALLSRFGTTLLILFDALTSFLAAGVGTRLLPEARAHIERAPTDDNQNPIRVPNRFNFYHCALVIGSFAFLYEIYEVGVAARCKILFGDQGLAVFSEMMVINTILCAGLSVAASKQMRNAANALPIGMLLLGSGLTLTLVGEPTRIKFFLGSFTMTFGEIIFNSLSTIVLIHLTPAGKRQGTTYSTGVFVQYSGRILGGVLAFPLVVASLHPLYSVVTAASAALAICFTARPLLKRLAI